MPPKQVFHPVTGKPILGDLPLEKYVLQSLDAMNEVGKKRALHSGLLTPHKRRMMEVAGILSPGKSGSASARPAELLSPAGPARRLDFSAMAVPRSPATPRKSVLDAPDNPFVSESAVHTPTAERPPPKLVPSPDIQGSARDASTDDDDDDDDDDDENKENDENAYPTPAATQENAIPDGYGSDYTEENKENIRPSRIIRKNKKTPTDQSRVLRPRVSSPAAPLAAPPVFSPRSSLPGAGSDRTSTHGVALFAVPGIDAALSLDHQPTDVQRKRGRRELELEVDEMDVVDDTL